MKTCKKCGTQNEDFSLYCITCGQSLETTDADGTDSKTAFTDIADKTLQNAKDLVGKLNTTVANTLEEQKAKSNEAAQSQIARAQHTTSHTQNSQPLDQAMSTTELWSWLQKSSKRQHFFTEENDTAQNEYMEKLQQKLADNKVPANVCMRTVQWDRSDVQQDIYLVQPVSNAVNPLSCLVQFNHVGNFTFVEEKTFITPPNLPEVPQKPVTISPELIKRSSLLLLGVVVIILSLLLLSMGLTALFFLALLFGSVAAWFGFAAQQELQALQKHNQKCAAQEIAWNAAWNNWENSIFLHSFQESVNGQISRIYDAVFECIKQLNEEMFSQKASEEQQESQSMNELEQLIARRKDDYR